MKERNMVSKDQFKQTVLALASAIDTKDKYTHGHSRRVAEYARMIAESAGKEEQECEEIYFAALLHDVGKIGVPDYILNKEGRLTTEEFDAIKQHPVLGEQILSEISSAPYLSIGAHYHHERYDGRGYPDGLKGKEIPDLARIIAVADAYDAMTSSRSYRKTLAQQKVREELVKGIGTQFDPDYVRIMIHFLDKDTEYHMKDDIFRYQGIRKELRCEDQNEEYSEGIEIGGSLTTITMSYEALGTDPDACPSFLLFDSLDERVHTDEHYKKEMEYCEFCRISLDGTLHPGQICDYRMKEIPRTEAAQKDQIVIVTLKQRDHILIRVEFSDVIREYTIAMYDRSRFAYVTLTGKQCRIFDISVKKENQICEEGFITRIREEVSYIDGPQGDIPNLEIAGWREKHSDGIEIVSGMTIELHQKLLPAATRLWHCPLLIVFYSEDGMVGSEGYRELAVIRFDGESWEEDPCAKNQMYVSFEEQFHDWESWKMENREGTECHLSLERRENQLICKGENHGISMLNITTLQEELPKLYLSISGDQVAITNIRIHIPDTPAS